MRIPRFRIRTMMVVVAIVAVLIGSSIQIRRLRGRSSYYNQRWVQAQNEGRALRATSAPFVQLLRNIESQRDEEFPADEKELRERAARDLRVEVSARTKLIEHFDRLEAKYRRAARYPWFPVASDPPTPN